MDNQLADRSKTEGHHRVPGVPVVTFVADNHYAKPLAAALSSVIANLDIDRKLRVFIVDGGVPQAKKDKINRLKYGTRVSIEWLKPSKSQCNLLKTLPSGYVGRNCYYKILIPELLGPEYPRIIYLDSDVIVEADIGELWDMNIGENYVLAARDLINPFVSSPFGLRNWRELGLRADEPLFNTGVLVLNSAKWNQENVFPRLVAYLRDNYRYVQLCDQDAMNAVFRREWGRFDSLWNVLPYMEIASSYSLLDRKSHEDLLMRASLIHFCGPGKPWSGRCTHLRRDRFFHYLDMTPWSEWRPKSWPIGPDSITYYTRRFAGAMRRAISSC